MIRIYDNASNLGIQRKIIISYLYTIYKLRFTTDAGFGIKHIVYYFNQIKSHRIILQLGFILSIQFQLSNSKFD